METALKDKLNTDNMDGMRHVLQISLKPPYVSLEILFQL